MDNNMIQVFAYLILCWELTIVWLQANVVSCFWYLLYFSSTYLFVTMIQPSSFSCIASFSCKAFLLASWSNFSMKVSISFCKTLISGILLLYSWHHSGKYKENRYYNDKFHRLVWRGFHTTNTGLLASIQSRGRCECYAPEVLPICNAYIYSVEMLLKNFLYLYIDITCHLLSFDRWSVHMQSMVNRFLVNKTNRCTEFQFYWYYDSTCFGQPFCPSSGVLIFL